MVCRCPICARSTATTSVHHAKEPHCRSIHIGKSLLAYSLTATSTSARDKADSTAVLSISHAVERRGSVELQKRGLS